ncbi:hypothetical protein V8D89_001846 [Ganoderma adspersum]
MVETGVNFHLLAKEDNNFRVNELVEEIVARMEANGEVVTRCTRGCVHAYVQGLRIQHMLSRHPSDQDLVQLSEKFQNAIERIRDSGVELDYSNAARLSSLLRVAAGKFKSLTLRDRVIELLDEIDALRAEYNTLKKEHAALKRDHEDLQVDYAMVREERDELQKEVHDLKAKLHASPEAQNADILATSSPRHAGPAHESSSTDVSHLYNAPLTPPLGQQQPARGTLSRVPTEIISPTTPPRASVSRNPSGILTPPTTDARRPLGRRLSRSDSSRSSAHRSSRENTPGAASVLGATPGSPSLRRHSPPLRQSSQNQNHTPSGSGLAREPSYSQVRTTYRNLMRLAQHHFDEQRVTIEHLEEQATQTHIETIQRYNALENERRRVQEELAAVSGELDELKARHRMKTQEYQVLHARYMQLRTRVETLTGTLKDITSDATAVVDEHNTPLTGATTGGAA